MQDKKRTRPALRGDAPDKITVCRRGVEDK